MISTTFASKKKFVELDDVTQTILVTDLTPEISQQISVGVCPNIAIEYPEGIEIPFKFKGKVDFASVNLDPNLSIKLEKTCYLRFIKTHGYCTERVRIYRSCDLKTWRKAGHFKNEGIFNIKQDRDKKMLVEFVTAP